MKRKTITTICMMFLMLCFCVSDVSAMEDSKANSRAVEGKTVFSLGPHTYISKIEGGHAVVVAGDGTRFELKGEGLDGWYLCIIELLEGDGAFEWLKSELKSNGKMQRAYAVLLKNSGGKELRLKNVAGEYVAEDKEFTVTVRVEMSGEGKEIWHVEPNGDKTLLQQIEGDGLSAIGTKADYYAVVHRESSNENPPAVNAPGDNAPGGNVPGGNTSGSQVSGGNTSGSHVPGSNVSKKDFGAIKTGDNAEVFFWLLLVIAGAAGCVAAVKNKKRNMYN